MGVFRKYGLKEFNQTYKYKDKLVSDKPHIVLINPQDTGNLGVIIKTISLMDYSNLAIIKPSTDVFDPKTIRASMGEIFNVNIEHYDNFSQYTETFNNKKMLPIVQRDKDSKELSNELIKDINSDLDNVSFLFGSEEYGISGKYKNISKYKVKIPNLGSSDRLHLSLEVGIVLYLINQAL
jgi:TrmH family RNA methyltransferase